MNIAFIDLEFGNLYTAYSSYSYPIELGVLLYNSKKNKVEFKGGVFRCNADLVLTKSLVDEVGVVKGVQHQVVNLYSREFNKPFDKKFRLSKKRQFLLNKRCNRNYKELQIVLSKILEEFNISQIVFWAKENDMKYIKKAGLTLSKIKIIDLQKNIQKATGYLFSLDKISLVNSYNIEKKTFSTVHFSYSIPEKHKFRFKPHKAIGDVARMFLIYREYHRDRQGFIQECQQFLDTNKEKVENIGKSPSK